MSKCQSPCRLSWTGARSDGPQGSAGGSGLPGSGCGWVCVHGSRGFLGGWVEAVCSVGAQLVREVIRSAKSVAHHIISTPAALEVLLWLSHGLEVHFDLHGEYDWWWTAHELIWLDLQPTTKKFILLEPTVPMWRLICHLVTTAWSKHNYMHNALSGR